MCSQGDHLTSKMRTKLVSPLWAEPSLLPQLSSYFHLAVSTLGGALLPHKDSFTFLVKLVVQFSSVQSLSRAQLCNPVDCSTPGFPGHHQLLELAETHVHQVSDATRHEACGTDSKPGGAYACVHFSGERVPGILHLPDG